MNASGIAKRLIPPRKRLLALLTLYILFILTVMFAGCADRIILHPSTEPIAIPGILRVEIPAHEGGKPVEVWTARSRGAATAEPLVYCLEFNGNASRAEFMAEITADEWGDRPIEVWAVNYPGYGGSTGPARMTSIPPAALAAYDALAAKANGKPIFLIGQSLGSTAALYVAANRPCAGVVLTNPPPLQNMILNRFGWWNLWLVAGPVALSVPSELNSLRNAPRVNAPAVFVLAGEDSVVPPKYANKVFEAYAGEKRAIRMPQADHNDPLDGLDIKAFDEALDDLWKRATSGATPQR